MENAGHLYAEEDCKHLNYNSFVPLINGNSRNDIVALICDNCTTNKGFLKSIGCVFIGCASHHFNLAVRNVLKEQEELIE